MSEASRATYGSLAKDSSGSIVGKPNTEQIIGWLKEFGPITVQDLTKKCQDLGYISSESHYIQENGQGYNEIVGKLSHANKVGLVDGDEKVPFTNPETGKVSWRTLYKWIPEPRNGPLKEAYKAKYLKLKEEFEAFKQAHKEQVEFLIARNAKLLEKLGMATNSQENAQ